MMMAKIAAMRSTCQRASVGAVLTLKNTVVSIGYNGPPANDDHCYGGSCPLDLFGSCVRSVHAEKNAIERIPESIYWWHEELTDFTLYVTHSPCENCAAAIVQEAIGAVYFETRYHNTTGIRNLIKHGVRCFRITPSGYEHEQVTNEKQELQEMPVTH